MQLSIGDVVKARITLKNIAKRTPLDYSLISSKKYDAQVYFKREDLQLVRSYKIRGAYNKISSLSKEAFKARCGMCKCW